MIIDGDDDYFGEDDHMSHHYATNVYFKDLPTYQSSKIEEFKKYKASVFKNCSILELSIFLLFSLWDELADRYVDYSGEMSKEEIILMLKARAKRRETSYEVYEEFAANPTPAAREILLSKLHRNNDSPKTSSMDVRKKVESLNQNDAFVDVNSK